MAVYFIPKHTARAVKLGSIRALLAAPRPGVGRRHRHVPPGGLVHLDVKGSGSMAVRQERIAVRPCILRARLVMTAAALVRVMDVQHVTPDGERFARLLAAAEQGAPGDTSVPRQALADWLGFDSWADIAGDDTVDNELIVWSAA